MCTERATQKSRRSASDVTHRRRERPLEAATSRFDSSGGRAASSHSRDAVNLHISNRILAVSANHFLVTEDGRVGGQALEPPLERRGSSPSAHAQHVVHEEGRARQDGGAQGSQILRGQLQQKRAVGEGLVVA